MKKHPTSKRSAHIKWHGNKYKVPISVLNQYKVEPEKEYYTIEETFHDIITKYTKAGVCLQGVRHKEGLTQVEFAKIIGVSQANLSAMENGKRPIGKRIAKRLEKQFGFDYRYFL